MVLITGGKVKPRGAGVVKVAIIQSEKENLESEVKTRVESGWSQVSGEMFDRRIAARLNSVDTRWQ